MAAFIFVLVVSVFGLFLVAGVLPSTIRRWPRGGWGKLLSALIGLGTFGGSVLLAIQLFPFTNASITLDVYRSGEPVVLARKEWSGGGRVSTGTQASLHSLAPDTGRLAGELRVRGSGADVLGDLQPFGAKLLAKAPGGRPVLVDPGTLALSPITSARARELAPSLEPGAKVRRVERRRGEIALTLADGRTHIIGPSGAAGYMRKGVRPERDRTRYDHPWGIAFVEPVAIARDGGDLFVVAHEELDRPATLYVARHTRGAPSEPAFRHRLTDLGVRGGELTGLVVTDAHLVTAWRGRPPDAWRWHDWFGNEMVFVMAQAREDGRVVWVTEI